MANSEDSKQSDDGSISAEMRSALTLIEVALNRSIQRKWAERSPKISREEALAQVKQTLSEQLFNRDLLNSKEAIFLRGSIAIEEVFDPIPPSEETIEAAIEGALDDYETFLAIRTLVVLGYDHQSPALKRFKILFLAGMIQEPKGKPGPSIVRDIHRNMIIASQVQQLECLGIYPTRNSATETKHSGCDLVALALSELDEHIEYSKVERIWKKRGQRPNLSILYDLLSPALRNTLPLGSASD